jgi:SSU ribosomal protein S3P
MGQKVHPYGFRLGITKNWRSRWFATHDYAKLLHEDLELKESLRQRLKAAGVSAVEVERPGRLEAAHHHLHFPARADYRPQGGRD